MAVKPKSRESRIVTIMSNGDYRYYVIFGTKEGSESSEFKVFTLRQLEDYLSDWPEKERLTLIYNMVPTVPAEIGTVYPEIASMLKL